MERAMLTPRATTVHGVLQATYTDGPPTGTGCPGEYTFVRTWSLQDASGNAAPDQQQQITVIDRTPPVFSTTDSPLNPDIEQFYCGQTWWYQASDQACHISRTWPSPSGPMLATVR
jgi:hypothetical protein